MTDLQLHTFTWIFPLFLTVLSNFLWGRMIYLISLPNLRKLLLWVGILQNLGLLYLLSSSALLPYPVSSFGVSVYSLQAISLLVDIYRKETAPSHQVRSFLGYFGFLPCFFSGPIFQYRHYVKQSERRHTRKNQAALIYFFYGALLYVYCTNSFTKVSHYFFLQETALSVLSAWIGAFTNYFELYFLFYAHTLMATGILLFFGFKLPENFKSPLLATSVTSFFDRWNITLGEWLKTYFYYPLAIRFKNSKPISAALLFVLMLFFGCWYGFETKFLAMGAWFGVWLIFEQVDRYHEKIPPFLKGFFTFLVVSTGFVFFRTKNLVEAERYFHFLFADNHWHLFPVELFQPLHLYLCTAGIVYVLLVEPHLRQRIAKLTS